VTFSEDADASLVNGTTVMLEKLGGAGDSALTLSASIELAARNSAVLLINPSPALAAGKYRVTLRGAGGAALANLQAETLGADASFEFTVEAAQ